ncbi:hypothetical protein N9V09_04430 [Prochlorococcus sp. AH-736-K20]|nr:hypothetical protein [Prochlorococcus sp. AH-736-K20]MDA9746635.1 hypothetical protein [Prochlorococcus sp. AH-736-K20]
MNKENPFLDYVEALKSISIEKEFKSFKSAWNKFSKLIILGNGGSNAVASHISQDYIKFHNKKSLVFSDPSMLTCFINDFGMENAYKKFIEYHSDPDTLIILISSGGESKNIVNCANYCEAKRIPYGILTGFAKDNTLRKISKNAIWDFHISSNDYGIVECIHQIFLHGVV